MKVRSHVAATVVCIICSQPTFVLAADKEVPMPFNLHDVVTNVLDKKTDSIMNIDEKKKALEKLQKYRIESESLVSSAYDNVTPITTPIYINMDGTGPMPVIKVTPTRPTTIAFLTEDGKPVPVGTPITKDPVKGETARFSVSKVSDLAHVYEFSTNVYKGETTMDLYFQNSTFPVTIKVVAGTEYHAGAKAIVLESSSSVQDMPRSEKDINKTSGSGAKMSQILSTLANTRTPPKNSTLLDIEGITPGVIKRPMLKIYRSRIEGETFLLFLTNGQLQRPDYIESMPSITVRNRLWAYAVPIENKKDIISITYGGINQLYAVVRQNPIRD
ncbi:DotH/IcmK family type IV secretion protein [Marinomonas sp. TI.3.20]|uniref:DotH/IcmK family type IV secretion protein n=1 Tax=Marinomonas sp. TI.3.20 TaxID=3121296 RepID=UPI00311E8642